MEANQQEMVRINVSTGAAESTGLQREELRSYQLHPSGRQVFFQAGRAQVEIWIAENILPRNGR